MVNTEQSTGSHAIADKIVGSDIQYEKFLDCVHCGLCTSACPTYLETGNENDSPRGRIYLMRSVVDGRLELNDTVKQHLDLCLDCRSCESACPSGVQYGRLIEPFRVAMTEQESARGSAASSSWFNRYILQGLFPYRNRMRWALWPMRIMQSIGLDRLVDSIGFPKLLPQKLQRMHDQLPALQPAGKPYPEVLPAMGDKRARVGLFIGCVADAMFGQTNWATARVLQHNGCEVVVPKNQACCGAIHYHNGAGDPAIDFAKINYNAFNDVDVVIVNVAGCGAMLKDYGHIAEELQPANAELHEQLAAFSAKIRDISEFLAELGPITPTGAINIKATYHDACHLCHAQQIREQPRELLKLIPGLELVPLEESEICCGAAGSYNLTEPEMSDQLARRKRTNIHKTGADLVITGNAGCLLQIQATLKHSDKPLPVMHPMDLLDYSYRNQRTPLWKQG